MPFSERTQKDLSGALKCFGYTVANVLLSSAKSAKNEAFFDILVTITLGVNMITRKAMPFFHLLFKLYQLVSSILAFKDLHNSVLPLHFVLFCKVHIYLHAKDATFKRVNMDILLYKKIC